MRVFTARSNVQGRFSQRKLYFEGKYSVEVTADNNAVEISCENDEGYGKEIIITLTREEADQIRLALNARAKQMRAALKKPRAALKKPLDNGIY